ncbi:MAG: serine/threonine-protein phosphatase [Phycisphaerae bacterium]|nr:serine/threonine-protein phosphatase [Phycisphaerae bacterium]
MPTLLDRLHLSPRREVPPRKSTFLLFTGIFFTFAPIGSLIAMVMGRPWPWLMGLVCAVVSGSIALGWASAFFLRRYWLLVPVILLQAAGPPLLFTTLWRWGLGAVGSGMGDQGRLLVHAGTALACMVAGFVLINIFIRTEESRITRYRTEVDMAQRIHKRLVPALTISAGSWQVLGRSEPSSEMGGDLIDALQNGDELDVFVADVSGHGVGAGIVMGMVKSAIRMRLRAATTLEGLLTDLNAVVTDLTDPNMFATFACVRAGTKGEIQYALAGHLPILVFRASTGEVIDLPNQHLPLGIESDEVYHAGRCAVGLGDTLLIVTDGLIEVQSPAGKELGLAEFRAAFASCASGPLPDVMERLQMLASSHGKRLDDQSLVLIRRVGA